MVAKATDPSGETVPVRGSSGSFTSRTWGWRRSSTRVAAIPALARGSRTVPPWAWNTTVASAPAMAGKLRSSRSAARWDSTPGTR